LCGGVTAAGTVSYSHFALFSVDAGSLLLKDKNGLIYYRSTSG